MLAKKNVFQEIFQTCILYLQTTSSSSDDTIFHRAISNSVRFSRSNAHSTKTPHTPNKFLRWLVTWAVQQLHCNHCIAYSKFIPILRSLNAQHRIYDPLHSMHQTRRELHTIGSVQSIHSSLVVYRCAQHTIANIKPSSVERARHQST